MLDYLWILIKKEYLQLLKDKSMFVLAFVLPVMLVIIYGSAIRMDIKPVKIAICSYNTSKVERTIVNEFVGSDYYEVTQTYDFDSAQKLLNDGDVVALLYLPKNLSNKLDNKTAKIMIYVNGAQAQLASLSYSYISNTLNLALNKLIDTKDLPYLQIEARNWFNESNQSVWFIMPGQYVSIMTLMCIFMGSFLIAREYDRQTIETLITTKASAFCVVLAKIIVYYLLALWSMAVILILGQLIYDIPIRGNILILIISLGVYALEMLCLGSLISAKLKSQFICVQMAVIIGFLPTVMLSGLIFDLRAVEFFIRLIGQILPSTYEIKAMRICMLSGGQYAYVIFNLGLQILFTVGFFSLAVKQVKKDLRK
ncbi:MAG: ABC transporter permease [Succinivibrio sp.]|nr:ABC transporter permease [Succinivibrio sp.]